MYDDLGIFLHVLMVGLMLGGLRIYFLELLKKCLWVFLGILGLIHKRKCLIWGGKEERKEKFLWCSRAV